MHKGSGCAVASEWVPLASTPTIQGRSASGQLTSARLAFEKLPHWPNRANRVFGEFDRRKPRA